VGVVAIAEPPAGLATRCSPNPRGRRLGMPRSESSSVVWGAVAAVQAPPSPAGG